MTKNLIKKPITGYKTQESVKKFAKAVFGKDLDKKEIIDVDPDPSAEGLKLPMKNGMVATVSDEAVLKDAWDSTPMYTREWEDLSAEERENVFQNSWFLDHLRTLVLKNKWRETIENGGSFAWVMDPIDSESRMWPEDDEKYVLRSDRCGIGRILAALSPYAKKHADGKRCKINMEIPKDAVEKICDLVHYVAYATYRTETSFHGLGLPTWEEAQPFWSLTGRPSGLAAAAKLGLINGAEIMTLVSDDEAEKEWANLPPLDPEGSLEAALNVQRYVDNRSLFTFLTLYQRDMHRTKLRGAIKPGKVYRTKVGKVLADGGWLWAPQYVFTIPGEPDVAGRIPCIMVERREAVSPTNPVRPYNMHQKRVFTDVNYEFELVACFDMIGYIDRAQLSGPVRDLIRVPMSDDTIMELVKFYKDYDLPKDYAPAGYWEAAAVSERLLYTKAESEGDVKPLGQYHEELYAAAEKLETPKES